MGFIDQVSHPYDGQSGCQTIEDRGKKIDADRPFGPNPSPSLSPVDSSLLGREPPAESIARFGDRVFRIPTAAEPLSHQSILRLCRGPSPRACILTDFLTLS